MAGTATARSLEGHPGGSARASEEHRACSQPLPTPCPAPPQLRAGRPEASPPHHPPLCSSPNRDAHTCEHAHTGCPGREIAHVLACMHARSRHPCPGGQDSSGGRGGCQESPYPVPGPLSVGTGFGAAFPWSRRGEDRSDLSSLCRDQCFTVRRAAASVQPLGIPVLGTGAPPCPPKDRGWIRALSLGGLWVAPAPGQAQGHMPAPPLCQLWN